MPSLHRPHAFAACAVAASLLSLGACETHKGAAQAADEGGAQATPASPAEGSAAKPGGTAPGKAATGKGLACGEVADHIIEVAMKQPNLSDAQLSRMEALAPRQKKLLTRTCESMPWPEDFRQCLAKAATSQDIQGCRRLMPNQPPPPQ